MKDSVRVLKAAAVSSNRFMGYRTLKQPWSGTVSGQDGRSDCSDIQTAL